MFFVAKKGSYVCLNPLTIVYYNMTIETTDQQYIIRVDRSTLSAVDVERALQQLRLLELAARLGGSEADALDLSQEINTGWWAGQSAQWGR